MFCCRTNPQDKQLKKTNDEIDARIKKDKAESQKVIKMLLLGNFFNL
jgi:hypothetical protein